MNFTASESQRVALQARCRDLPQKNAAPLSPPRHEARAGQLFDREPGIHRTYPAPGTGSPRPVTGEFTGATSGRQGRRGNPNRVEHDEAGEGVKMGSNGAKH